MHEFDGGGELDMALAGVVTERGCREREHGAQTLATGIDQVIGNLGDHLDIRADTRQNQLVDPFHAGFAESEERLKAWYRFSFERDYNAHNPPICHSIY